jgi:lysophospholipase L1-like esterase
MFECLILGDSIAVGTHMARPECVAYAKVGINSKQFNQTFNGEFFSNYVIISLGSNDQGIKTYDELKKLRSRILAKEKVIWILPSINEPAIMSVIKIADEHKDILIGPHPKLMSRDGIHPTRKGYEWLATFTKEQQK